MKESGDSHKGCDTHIARAGDLHVGHLVVDYLDEVRGGYRPARDQAGAVPFVEAVANRTVSATLMLLRDGFSGSLRLVTIYAGKCEAMQAGRE